MKPSVFGVNSERINDLSAPPMKLMKMTYISRQGRMLQTCQASSYVIERSTMTQQPGDYSKA